MHQSASLPAAFITLMDGITHDIQRVPLGISLLWSANIFFVVPIRQEMEGSQVESTPTAIWSEVEYPLIQSGSHVSFGFY